MSVSMLLNAADVVTAASEQRRVSRDAKRRISINSLLSRSVELPAEGGDGDGDCDGDCDGALSLPAPPSSEEADAVATAARDAQLAQLHMSGTHGIIACCKLPVPLPPMMATRAPRRRWKQWEDELLQRVVNEHGATKWNHVATHFIGRNGRQVRLRWMNHLQPSLEKRPWSVQEDRVLLDSHSKLGNKWALISVKLCGRSDNSVKNRYKSLMRRALREGRVRK